MTYLPLSEWKQYYKAEKSDRIEWDEAINDVMIASREKDFDPDSTLGRGAWRRKDGELCYHDGIDTFGSIDPSKIYLRKMKKDIGITGPVADVEICQSVGRIALEMTFESRLDAVRCLAWSCLAPFSGALPWRPACLLTGGSGTGKSQIIEKIVTPIADPEFFNGAQTTPAYLRAKIASDAKGIVFDETEGGEKAEINRKELFLVMRQSTSDNAPKVGKSNKDQGIIEYSMKCMFMFASIHAGVDDEADEKRILRINLIKKSGAESKWKHQKAELARLLTEENCRGIRALTWKKLPEIIKLSEILDTVLSRVTGMDLRSSFAEALIVSTYFIIWRGMTIEECTEELAEELIAQIYLNHEVEERNEPKETFDRLLDSIVFLPGARENKTLREMLIAIDKSDTDGNAKEYTETLERYGLKVIPPKDVGLNLVAVQKDNIMIRKLLETGNGYNKILWRHENCVDRSKAVRMSGSPRTCVTIRGVFDVGECDVEEIPL